MELLLLVSVLPPALTHAAASAQAGCSPQASHPVLHSETTVAVGLLLMVRPRHPPCFRWICTCQRDRRGRLVLCLPVLKLRPSRLVPAGEYPDCLCNWAARTVAPFPGCGNGRRSWARKFFVPTHCCCDHEQVLPPAEQPGASFFTSHFAHLSNIFVFYWVFVKL